jgi:hypothetical protein
VDLTFEPVAQIDSFGRGYRHRACRVVFQVGEIFSNVCWAVMESDGSASLGLLTPDFVPTATGISYQDAQGRLLTAKESTLEMVPLSQRTNPHITLHPSGVCHGRTGAGQPLFRCEVPGWHPVSSQFTWMHIFTGPVSSLPPVTRPGSRDAVVAFPNGSRSARIQVDLLPPIADCKCPIEPSAIHTVAGIAPGYVVRLSVFDHAPVSAALFVTDWS